MDGHYCALAALSALPRSGGVVAPARHSERTVVSVFEAVFGDGLSTSECPTTERTCEVVVVTERF